MPPTFLQPYLPGVNQQAPPCALNVSRQLDLFPHEGEQKPERNPRRVSQGSTACSGVSVSLPTDDC